MFESLAEKLQSALSQLSRKGRLSEADVDAALKQVRIALLEADVNFKVVKAFVGSIRERALGTELLASLSPAQHVIKIVHQELTNLLGPEQARLNSAPSPPTLIMLVGLQGSGKTTTAAKLASYLRRHGQSPLLVACDPYRPAAVEQLQVLGKQLEVPVFTLPGVTPPQVAAAAAKQAAHVGCSHVILDTAGRLHVDDQLMQELADMKSRVGPHDVLLTADAMTGQDAVNVAEQFNHRVGLTGAILTKLDGDARGGAALSIRAATGVPVKLVGVGEKLEALEPFFPDRMASRILGMGDVLSLIERSREAIDQESARRLEKKVRSATFDLNDFAEHLRQVRKMGPLQQVLEMVPGLSKAMKAQGAPEVDERQLKRVEAIILSMTPIERANPHIIGGSRKRRVARGSGATPADVNQLLSQFGQMQKLLKIAASGRPAVGQLSNVLRGMR